MKPSDNIEKIFTQTNIETNTDVDKVVLSDAVDAMSRSKQKTPVCNKPSVWRIIMQSKITKLATAATIIIIASLFTIFLDKSVSPAYALEQTIEASRTMRYIHTKYFHDLHDDVAKECWLEFDEAGSLKNVRINWSDWFGNGKVVVWNKNKTVSWYQKTNLLITFNDELYTSRIHSMIEADDPRLMAEQLYESHAKGQVTVETDESGDKDEPIVVTATYLPGSGSYGWQKVLFIDRSTKLVTSLEIYVLKEKEYKYYGMMEYYNYDVPIDANMFNLDDEVSSDATRVDRRTQDVGLLQGSLTDKEIATKTVREYLDALIAKDYTNACKIRGAMSHVKIQLIVEKMKVIRIVSIGEPAKPDKHSKIHPKRLHVPYTIEREKDGQTIQELRECRVTPVLGQRDRWGVQYDRLLKQL